MELELKRRDIQMNRLVTQGKSDKMKKLDFNHQKLTILQEKINGYESKIDQNQEIIETNQSKIKEDKTKFNKLLKIAKMQGVDLN